MQRSILSVVLLLIFIIGCSQDESPLSIEPNQSSKELLKLPSIKKDNSTSSQITVSKEIKGSIGGVIPFEYQLASGITVKGTLTIPAKSFKSKEVITIVFNDEYAVADFYPSPFKFDKPLLLTYSYEGINLQGIDANNLDFYYIADTGHSELIKSKQKIISNSNKRLGIVEAELEHFSAFGWKR